MKNNIEAYHRERGLTQQLAAALEVSRRHLVCMVLCFSVCFQSLLFTGLYYYYAKKY